LTERDQQVEQSQLCVPDWFEAQVEKTPNAIAVQTSNASLTYRELNQRANQLAHYLQSLGVGAETLVGVCFPRSIDFVLSALGVLKAGGAYVPLDPEYPMARLAFMLEDAQVPILLTQDSLVDRLPTTWAHLFCLDSDWDGIEHQPQDNPTRSITPQNRAYVIYTSGSTGQPKGVEIEQASLTNLVAWHHQAYGVRESDRVTQLASPAFDASVWEIWTGLTAGASLHIPNEATRKTPVKLLDWLVSEGITLSFMPTALAETVLDQALPDTLALRVLLTGGDTFRRSLQKPLSFQLVNHYGPTENTVVTTCAPILMDAPLSIGRAIANTQVYVLNDQSQPVAIGESGELYIGGAGLARGYLNQPELTAEKFISNPFDSSTRLYKTGDLARYLPDGNLEFLGRIDHQVQIRGFRIELGEIETAIAHHPQVREAVVVASEDQSGSLRLVAYLVPLQEPFRPDDLRAFLAERLPEYMLPAIVMMLEALPLSPNGKIDRSALPQPTPTRLHTTEAISPQTEIEQKIAAIWQEVLSLTELSVDDNFFDLGGHSIHIGIVNGKLKEKFDRDLSMVEMFEYSTIRSLAQFLSQAPLDPTICRESLDSDIQDRAQQQKAARNRLSGRSKSK
jgi:amino acid adenylation domain-containing protein